LFSIPVRSEHRTIFSECGKNLESGYGAESKWQDGSSSCLVDIVAGNFWFRGCYYRRPYHERNLVLVGKHKAKREQEKESRTRAAMLRQAARLIDEEFYNALVWIRLYVQEERWGDVSDLKATTATWEEHKKLLATELSNSVWDLVRMGNALGKQVLNLHDISIDSSTSTITADILELLKAGAERLEEGCAALAPFVTLEPSEK
jgi:hypothetical protein